MREQWKLVFILITLAICSVVIAILTLPKNDILKVVACDVGQGDAFLIQHNNSQVLIDGGVGNKVVDCLSSHLPFWDRKIEVIVLTHPQQDHYEGLIEVIRRYQVDLFIASEFNNSTEGFELLKKEVGVRGITILNPNPDKDVRLGMIYLDILYPLQFHDIQPENVLGVQDTSDDLNDTSIVLELIYGDFEMLFTGDIGPNVVDEVIGAGVTDVDVLKVPHHGSKNGLTADLLKVTEPEIAIISAGHKNRFGHPHQEVLDLLSESRVRVLRTDEMGEVVISTDGSEVWY